MVTGDVLSGRRTDLCTDLTGHTGRHIDLNGRHTDLCW